MQGKSKLQWQPPTSKPSSLLAVYLKVLIVRSVMKLIHSEFAGKFGKFLQFCETVNARQKHKAMFLQKSGDFSQEGRIWQIIF